MEHRSRSTFWTREGPETDRSHQAVIGCLLLPSADRNLPQHSLSLSLHGGKLHVKANINNSPVGLDVWVQTWLLTPPVSQVWRKHSHGKCGKQCLIQFTVGRDTQRCGNKVIICSAASSATGTIFNILATSSNSAIMLISDTSAYFKISATLAPSVTWGIWDILAHFYHQKVLGSRPPSPQMSCATKNSAKMAASLSDLF